MALVATGGGAAILWSDESGLFARRLDPHGRPRAEALRLDAPCRGGLAAVAAPRPQGEDDLLVSCARPADRDRDRQGAVVLSRLHGDGLRMLGQAGPIGPESFGVDVARRGARVVMGWRDADVLTAHARLAEYVDGALGASSAASTGSSLASAPSLAFDGDDLVVAWTESWLDRGGQPSGHLLVRREAEPPRPSLSVGDFDVRVHLAWDAVGPMVTLRDTRPRGARHRLFIGRLDERLGLALPDARSPGRADARRARPMLVPCGGHVFAVATRRSSREVTMVTLRRLDAALRPVEDEQQVYEYHVRMPHAVAACVDGRLLVAVGEDASRAEPRPRLRTYELSCGPGVPHARTP